MSTHALEAQQPLLESVENVELKAGDGIMWWADEKGNRVSPTFTKPVQALEWRNSRGFGEQPISEVMKKQVARLNAQLENERR